jgi:N-acetylmuramoyl-L-alanine amidase CwlA
LLKERGWGIDKVFKHQDFNGKYCPHRTLDMGWQRFIGMIEKELKALEPQAPVTEEKKETAKKETRTNVQLACAVWQGEFGNGEARKKALGDRYAKVQALVEKGVGKSKTSAVTNEALADEIMQGLWGNGSDRRKNLESNGFNYEAVQKTVNNKYY